MEEKDPEDLFKEAVGLLQASYEDHVRDLARYFFAEVKAERVTCRDDADRWIRETVDGDSWVIYTRKAQAVLLCSSNDGCGLAEGIIGTESFRDGMPWSQLAYHAMFQDLVDEIVSNQDEHGIDINEDDLGIDEPEDEDEEPESDPSP